jgi:hypothetical protein
MIGGVTCLLAMLENKMGGYYQKISAHNTSLRIFPKLDPEAAAARAAAIPLAIRFIKQVKRLYKPST